MPRFEGIRKGYVGRVENAVVVVRDRQLVPEQVQFEFDFAMRSLVPAPPDTLAELRDALGGTNKAAKLISIGDRQGVAPRTLQRYIAAEEHRAVSEHSKRRQDYAHRQTIIEQLQDAWQQRFGADAQRRAQAEGVQVRAVGSMRIGSYTEGRFVSIRLPGKAWKTILRRWNQGDRKGAAQHFQRWFGRTYGRVKPKGRGDYREDFTWAYLNELTFEPPN